MSTLPRRLRTWYVRLEVPLMLSSLTGGLALWAIVVARATPPPLPDQSLTPHVGATSCAGSSCHGITATWQRLKDSSVKQTEHIVWRREDAHARAYDTLLSERSQRIAQNLGLDTAHTADQCLDCHADNPPRTEPSFVRSQGVGCEACHGGAREWLSSHVTTNSHAANLAAGLYPTEAPLERARLCLSCHLGNADKTVDHRLLGAGHPRLSFELDTFTTIQPAHYVVDADYLQRKGGVSPARTWAVGQAIAATLRLQTLAHPERGRDGLYPELSLYDCHACHHPQEALRFESRESVPSAPGRPRIDDAHILMLRAVATQVAPEQARQLAAGQRALHAAADHDWATLQAAASDLAVTTDTLAQTLADWEPVPATLWATLHGVVRLGAQGEYTDYAAAEQATMALGALLSGLERTGGIEPAPLAVLSTALEGCYAATEDETAWSPPAFREALATFAAASDSR